jgi:hypothetical protein
MLDALRDSLILFGGLFALFGWCSHADRKAVRLVRTRADHPTARRAEEIPAA